MCWGKKKTLAVSNTVESEQTLSPYNFLISLCLRAGVHKLFSEKGQIVNNISSADRVCGLCCDYWILHSEHENHRHFCFVNKWVWLYSNKTL